MESLRELYRIGTGPSSSHTMGPRLAAQLFLSENDGADHYKCKLYGSLALTGRGHFTDSAILEEFANKRIEIEWHPQETLPLHPNALRFIAYNAAGNIITQETYYSIGGGKVVTSEDFNAQTNEVYPQLLSRMEKILAYCDKEGLQFWEVALKYEGADIMDYMETVWKTMKASIVRGLEAEGVLKGGLKLQRKADSFHSKAYNFSGPLGATAKALSYALAVSEENASGGVIVTAPTCGSCGILPATLYYLQRQYEIPDKKIYRALLTAGIFGNVVKYNGSISGAEVGCQGEVGVACAMASAAATQILGGTIFQIEYAAELGLEHHLGLTCDPMLGLVQIPCIERNAMATARALNHATYALLSDGRHRVSFDNIISVMMETGNAIPPIYKETSMGGLATVK